MFCAQSLQPDNGADRPQRACRAFTPWPSPPRAFAARDRGPDQAPCRLIARSASSSCCPGCCRKALTSATRALYSRGDLDLLLASPLSPRILTSRGARHRHRMFRRRRPVPAADRRRRRLARRRALAGDLSGAGRRGAVRRPALGLLADARPVPPAWPETHPRGGSGSGDAGRRLVRHLRANLQFHAAGRRAPPSRMHRPSGARRAVRSRRAGCGLPARAAAGDVKALAIWAGVERRRCSRSPCARSAAPSRAAPSAPPAQRATARDDDARRTVPRERAARRCGARNGGCCARDPYLVSQIAAAIALHRADRADHLEKPRPQRLAGDVHRAGAGRHGGADLAPSLAWLAASSEDAPAISDHRADQRGRNRTAQVRSHRRAFGAVSGGADARHRLRRSARRTMDAAVRQRRGAVDRPAELLAPLRRTSAAT